MTTCNYGMIDDMKVIVFNVIQKYRYKTSLVFTSYAYGMQFVFRSHHKHSIFLNFMISHTNAKLHNCVFEAEPITYRYPTCSL